MIQSEIELNHSVATAIVRTIQNPIWYGRVLYSESNSPDYYHGEASFLANHLMPVNRSEIPDRGDVLKEESETLYVDEERGYIFIITLRKYHYATTMTVERRNYE